MFISIVIPLYNKAEYVARAIQSVLNQNHENFELIIVDDGSTDNSAKEVKKFKDSRITLIQQKNKGVSAARNRGVYEAHSEWVAFLDADDEWMRDFLSIIIKGIHNYSAVRIIGVNSILKGDNEKVLVSENINGIVKDFFKASVENGCLYLSSSITIHRKTFLAIGGFPIGVPVGEDTDLWARLAWTAPVAFINKKLVFYYTQTSGNTVTSNYPVKFSYPVILQTYKQWKKIGKIEKQYEQSSKIFIGHAILYYLNNILNKNGNRGFCLFILLLRFQFTFLNPHNCLEMIRRCLPDAGIKITFKIFCSLVYNYSKFKRINKV